MQNASLFFSLHLAFDTTYILPALFFLLFLILVLFFVMIFFRAKEKKKYVDLLDRYLGEMEKTNLALKEADKKCQRLMDHMGERLLRINDKGIVLFSNNRACGILGLPIEKIIHQPLPSWLTEGKKHPLSLKGKIKKGLRFSEKIQIMRGDKPRWIRLKWSFQPTDLGEPGAVIVISDISENLHTEEKIQLLISEVNEKNKQINCLFDISDISGVPNISFDGIFERSLEIIPNGLKYSHDTWVEIVFEGKRFVSKNFRETPWNFNAPIKIRKKKLGHIRVGYLEEKPKSIRDAFHINEKLLIKNIAERLGQVIEMMNMENHLKECLEKQKPSAKAKKLQ
jgi:PAS domain-containing protein